MGDRKSAIDLHNKGHAAVTDKSVSNYLQIGYQLFCSSVIADPTFAQGWYQVGSANGDMNALYAAIACDRRASELEPTGLPGDLTHVIRVKALTNMVHWLHRLGRHDEAMDYIKLALAEAEKLTPGELNIGTIYMNLALIKATWGNNGEAVKFARKAYELDQSPVVEVCLALRLLFNRDMAEGYKHFEARFAYRIPEFLNYPWPKWDGSAGKVLFLMADQGMGDTLSLSRFVEQAAAKCKFVHIAIQPELLRVFRGTFAHIKNMDITPLPCPFPGADCWSTMVSLPHHLGLTDEEIINARGVKIPNFSAPAPWKSGDRKFHIGVAWCGSESNDINHWRSFPVTQLLELYRVPGVQLYSLQLGPRAADLHNNGCAALIRDLQPYLRDVGDTFGVIEHLDLVVGVESAIGHICGAVGKEFWCPYSFEGRDYRFGYDGSDIIWYPTHRVFKQWQKDSWQDVFNRIVEALHDRVAGCL